MSLSANPLFVGVTGKMGNLVVKQYEDKTVVTSVPDMSGRKLSEKQKESTMRMKLAIQSAKSIIRNPRAKQRACEMLGVPSNKVFRALVKRTLLTDEYGIAETEQEKQDKRTLAALKTIITTDISDAELNLFGNRAKDVYDAQGDWDILILTTADYPNTVKWELQEKLFAVTINQGTRVNILLVQKVKWYTEVEYEVLREKVEESVVPIA